MDYLNWIILYDLDCLQAQYKYKEEKDKIKMTLGE